MVVARVQVSSTEIAFRPGGMTNRAPGLSTREVVAYDVEQNLRGNAGSGLWSFTTDT